MNLPPPAVKERWKKTSVLLLKRTFFSNVQLWRLVFLNPVGVQRRTVSHFKGLFKTFKMRYSMFLYSNWIGLHVHFKKAILHLKRANMQFFLSICVTAVSRSYSYCFWWMEQWFIIVYWKIGLLQFFAIRKRLGGRTIMAPHSKRTFCLHTDSKGFLSRL